jgi:hypothetical protein
VRAAQKKAPAEAKATKKREAEKAMVGEASVTKVNEAMTAKADEAEAVKADEHATPSKIGMMATEATLMSPRMEDQLEGHGEAREVHSISSDEPPRPHGKEVMDANVSSTMEMASLGAREEQEVEGNLALVRVEAPLVPVFLGSPEEEEEAHWTILEGFRNLAERSLQMALRILTKDLPHAIEVSPSLFS